MKLLIYAAVIYLAYLLVKKFLSPSRQGRRAEVENSGGGAEDYTANSVETVEDPVCSSFIAKDSALKIRDGDELYYFCSDDCRSKFLDARRL